MKQSNGKARKVLHCKGKAKNGEATAEQGNPGHRKGRVMKRKAMALIGLVKALIRHAKAKMRGFENLVNYSIYQAMKRHGKDQW